MDSHSFESTEVTQQWTNYVKCDSFFFKAYLTLSSGTLVCCVTVVEKHWSDAPFSKRSEMVHRPLGQPCLTHVDAKRLGVS